MFLYLNIFYDDIYTFSWLLIQSATTWRLKKWCKKWICTVCNVTSSKIAGHRSRVCTCVCIHLRKHIAAPLGWSVWLPCRSRALCRWADSFSRCWRGWSCCRPTLRRCPPSPPHPLAPNLLLPTNTTRTSVCVTQTRGWKTTCGHKIIYSIHFKAFLTESDGSWALRLFHRSFSSSSITWFIALFSHVSTATPASLSRSSRASAFAFTVYQH